MIDVMPPRDDEALLEVCSLEVPMTCANVAEVAEAAVPYDNWHRLGPILVEYWIALGAVRTPLVTEPVIAICWQLSPEVPPGIVGEWRKIRLLRCHILGKEAQELPSLVLEEIGCPHRNLIPYNLMLLSSF